MGQAEIYWQQWKKKSPNKKMKKVGIPTVAGGKTRHSCHVAKNWHEADVKTKARVQKATKAKKKKGGQQQEQQQQQ